MNAPRHGKRDKPSTWSRSRRELASPQGISLTIALVICFAITVIGMILESYLHVPKDIIYAAIIISYIIIIAVAMFRISRMNKRAAEARREEYQKKFGRKSL